VVEAHPLFLDRVGLLNLSSTLCEPGGSGFYFSEILKASNSQRLILSVNNASRLNKDRHVGLLLLQNCSLGLQTNTVGHGFVCLRSALPGMGWTSAMTHNRAWHGGAYL
jgi:hypothetical protein